MEDKDCSPTHATHIVGVLLYVVIGLAVLGAVGFWLYQRRN
jgi:LPXTG-motif cell wall-anchored protein